jgi:transcriptional regulator of acetoin/glycerol metabolism
MGLDRQFFGALADVVFGNPFTARRDAVIVRLAPGAPRGDLFSDREALARVVAPKLEALLRDDGAALRRLSAEDRKIAEPALLYVGYHRAVPQLDALIERQADKNAPLPVPFGDEAIGGLVKSGFDEERAARYFSLYYQLRRGFYFIQRSLAGRSESMRRFREALWNRMEDFSTLLLGETGTGKGQAAAAIGRSAFIPYLVAERRFAASFTDTFLAINLSQYSEDLIESELFGHRKGAFTGAIDHHQGVFERCSPHGALFLDEIGEVSVPAQIKLLQVLQERSFTPVGGRDKLRFSGRVIAATNRSLKTLRRDGGLRDDFFYRLCSDVIEVPPLRRRLAESPGELEELVRLLVERIAGSQDAALVATVLEGLHRDVPRGYAWPGNVRELEQAVRRVLLTGRYAPELAAAADPDEALVEKLRAGELTAAQLLARYSAMLYRRLGSYAAVAKRTDIDPRTSRKYVDGARTVDVARSG